MILRNEEHYRQYMLGGLAGVIITLWEPDMLSSVRMATDNPVRFEAPKLILPRITVPPMIKGADFSFVSGLRGRGGLLIRLVRHAVTLSSKGYAGTTVAVPLPDKE